MKLWLVTREGGADYDEFDAFVIRAETAKRAEEIARTKQSGTFVVTEVLTEGVEAIILDSFRAG